MSQMPAKDVLDGVGRAPRLTIALPVYNGEAFIAESLDSLLAQTYSDFELLISDNASTDGTEAICRRYAELDPRIRYIKQACNKGAVVNHNLLVPLARGELFKWASHDDVYAPTLVEACVRALDRRPDAVLAHSDDAFIDASGKHELEPVYAVQSDDPRPWVRLHSLLVTPGGNDFYGVMRTDVLRSVPKHASYYNADRVFVAGLILAGRFAHVPEVLYYRRDHPQRASRAGGIRAQAAALEPRRSHRLRNPVVRLLSEYLLGLVVTVMQSPLPLSAKIRCLGACIRWLFTHVVPGRATKSLETTHPALSPGHAASPENTVQRKATS